MPRKTVVCPECRKPVPSGRLACPACGSLVAAVTGPTRRPARTASAGATDVARTAAADRNAGRPDAGESIDADSTQPRGTDLTTNGADDMPIAPAAYTSAASAAHLLGASQPMQPSKQRSAALGPSIPPVLADWPPKPPRTLDDPTGRDLEGVHRSGWDDSAAAAAGVQAPPLPASPVSGAYVPPSSAASATSYLAPSSISNAAPESRAVGRGQQEAAVATEAAAVTRKPLRPGSASLFADLPFDAPNTLIDWLVAFGGGAATIGFFLPWSSVVIGAASGGGSYMETWAIANPTHLLVALVSFAGFVLSVLPNRVPRWLRSSLLGLVLGGVLIGLVWPYLFAAGFGYKVGVIVEIVGALVLIVAGVLSILPSRHDSDASSV